MRMGAVHATAPTASRGRPGEVHRPFAPVASRVNDTAGSESARASTRADEST
jgi:hypothetical protein